MKSQTGQHIEDTERQAHQWWRANGEEPMKRSQWWGANDEDPIVVC